MSYKTDKNWFLSSVRRMRYSPVTIGFLLFLVAACQKEEPLETCSGSCTVVTGRLVTTNGRVPIQGAGVTVEYRYQAGLGYRSRAKTRTTTNRNGEYRLSFYPKDAELQDGYFEVTYQIDKNKYYAIGNDDDGVALWDVKRDTLLQLRDYNFPRKAYLRLAITNQSELIADKGQFLTDFNSCYGQNSVFHPNIQGGGAVVFWNGLPSKNPIPLAGDQPIIVRNYKTKQGINTVSRDSLFIPAGTTQTYTVTY